jgi:hypothetical protein
MEPATNKTFVLNLSNTSSATLDVVLEPPCYCESLEPGEQYKLSVTVPCLDDLTNFFHLEYSQNQITVFLNHSYDKWGTHIIKVEIPGREDFTFTL